MKAKVIISRIVFILYLATVAYLCLHNFKSLPVTRGTLFGLPTDKVVHFSMFFPIPFLSYISYNKKEYGIWQSIKYLISATLMAIAVALATEYLQSFVPGRCPDKMDLFADCVGIAVCTIPVFAYDLYSNYRHKNKITNKHKRK